MGKISQYKKLKESKHVFIQLIMNILDNKWNQMKIKETIIFLTTDQKVSGLNPDGVTKTKHNPL